MTHTSLDPVGRQCLSFTVSGQWAHFRRIDTTTDKQTYSVIPRTTVAGLIGAILGKPRDSYYHLFAPDTSAIAIEPLEPVRTMQLPMLTLPTEEGDIKQAEHVSGKVVIDPTVIEEERKRRTFEYLLDPAYRIDVILKDAETYESLKTALETGTSVYTPALGKTECLATVECGGPDSETATAEFDVHQAADVDAIDSIVPESKLTPRPNTSYAMERTPAYMEQDGAHRRTTGFLSYGFSTAAEPLPVQNVSATTVDGRTVCFV